MANFITLPLSSIVTSAETDQLDSALLNVQTQIEPIKKDMQGHKHKYANINTVLDAILPALRQNKIKLEQHPVTTEHGHDLLVTIFKHVPSGQFSASSMKIIHDGEDNQSYGGGITYARRYALVSILGLPQEDDDGAYQKEKLIERRNGEERDMITPQQMDELKGLIREKGQTPEGMKELFHDILNKTKKSKLEQLTQKQYYFVKKEFF